MGLLNSLRKYCVMKKVRERADESDKKKSEQEQIKTKQFDLKYKQDEN